VTRDRTIDRPSAVRPEVGRSVGDPLVNRPMLAIATGATLVPLNSTMLAVALPSIATTFGITPTDVASLVTLYLGAVAVTLPASGSVGDRFGHRRSFRVGVIGFGLASLIAALAPTFAVLAFSRVLQAATGSLVSTSSVALIRELAPRDRRGSTFGAFDMLTSISAALAPLVGGLIVDAFDWRAMFFVAAPIALLAVVGIGIRDPGGDRPTVERPSAPRSIDVTGLTVLALLLIAALVALRGGDTVLPAIAVTVVLLVVFVVVEGRAREPAVDPQLFRSRTFAAAALGVAGATVVLHATLVIVPLLIERLDRGDPATSGLALLGISAMWAVAAPIGGRWSDRAGRRVPVVAGSAVMALGLAVLWVVAGSATALVIGLLLAVVGLGMGLSGSPRQVAALEAIDGGWVGMAAGTYYTCRYLGGVVGASLAGAVLGARVTQAGVSTGFAILAMVAVVLVLTSFGIAGRARRAAEVR